MLCNGWEETQASQIELVRQVVGGGGGGNRQLPRARQNCQVGENRSMGRCYGDNEKVQVEELRESWL